MSKPNQRILLVIPLPRPGGVGDYAQGLAGNLRQRGWEVVLAAPSPRGGEDSALGGGCWKVWTGGTEGLGKAGSAALPEAWRPTLVSVQFVAFGYARRGWCRDWAGYFRRVVGGAPCQVVLHELWCGLGRRARLREKALGWIQRRQILRWTRSPEVHQVRTTNGLYLDLLRRQGVAAELLPLFGNIPLRGLDERPLIANLLRQIALPSAPPPLVCGLFGTIYRDWEFARPLARVADLAARLGRPPALLLLGRNGDSSALLHHLTGRYGAGFPAIPAGERAPEELDGLLSVCDLALAPTPARALGKSGAALAFLERGVPLITDNPDAADPSLGRYRNWILPADPVAAMARLQQPRGQPPGSRLAEVADQYDRDWRQLASVANE